jgi:hypothetical protein
MHSAVNNSIWLSPKSLGCTGELQWHFSGDSEYQSAASNTKTTAPPRGFTPHYTKSKATMPTAAIGTAAPTARRT